MTLHQGQTTWENSDRAAWMAAAHASHLLSKRRAWQKRPQKPAFLHFHHSETAGKTCRSGSFFLSNDFAFVHCRFALVHC
jgi:hypothetical protein